MRSGPSFNIAAIFLALLGAGLLVGGLFAPAATCEEGPDSDFLECQDEELPLLDTEEFEDDDIEFAEAVSLNLMAVNLLGLAGFAVLASFVQRALIPIAITIMGFLVYQFYITLDEIDRLGDNEFFAGRLEFSMGWAWFLLFGGGLMLLIAGTFLLFEHASRQRAGDYARPGYGGPANAGLPPQGYQPPPQQQPYQPPPQATPPPADEGDQQANAPWNQPPSGNNPS